MMVPKQVYYGLPRGIDKLAALFVLVINVIAPGIGTIISAFLAAETENDTIFVGIAQLLTSPLLGLGFVWAIVWSVRLYNTADTTTETGETSGLLQRDTSDASPSADTSAQV